MPSGDHAAVRCSIKVGFSPVPRGVKADGPPEGTRIPEAETEDESNGCRGKESNWRFAGITAVDSAKCGGKDDRSPPEADAARQGVLQVAAQQRFLEDSYKNECYSPCCGIFPGSCLE